MKSEPSNDEIPVEQTLLQIAEECGISIIRWDDESLADFADRLIEDIAVKILEADAFIDEIRQLDLSDGEQRRC